MSQWQDPASPEYPISAKRKLYPGNSSRNSARMGSKRRASQAPSPWVLHCHMSGLTRVSLARRTQSGHKSATIIIRKWTTKSPLRNRTFSSIILLNSSESPGPSCTVGIVPTRVLLTFLSFSSPLQEKYLPQFFLWRSGRGS